MAVVTFSREAHSGTRDLARLLASRLGYRYVSRDELTQAITRRSGVEREPSSDETEGRALSKLEQLGEQLTGDREAYVAALKAVITDIAAADNVVIVGHGAGLFLGDMRSVVRVFVVAPMEDRVTRLLNEGLAPSPDDARKMLEREDRESADYLRYLFGISDWLDPHNWDLVVNSGRADLESTLEMLVRYTEQLVRDRAEQTDLDRKRLASRIEERLLADQDLGVDKLAVFFAEGAVVIQGEALTQEDRNRAEMTARAAAPEAVIDIQIVLRPPVNP